MDISSRRLPGQPLVADIPKGNWKVMAFYLDDTIRPASQKGGYADYLDSAAMDAFITRNAAGGQAYFLPKPEPWVLDWTLAQALPVRDVKFDAPIPLLKQAPEYDGALTYMHKVKFGRDIYFFANSTSEKVETTVTLRGRKSLRIWNPHTGDSEAAAVTHSEAAGQPVASLRLVLPPVSSLFNVGE